MACVRFREAEELKQGIFSQKCDPAREQCCPKIRHEEDHYQ